MRIATLFLLILSSCVSSTGASDGESANRLRVASDLENPPFAWMDSSGEPQGRDVEMMKRLANEVELELVWVRLPFEELLEALGDGRAEVVCATLGVTEERARMVNFTDPYFETSIAVVIRSGFGKGPDLATRLAGHRVRAAAGTTSELAVLAELPDSVLVSGGKSERSSAELLQDGEVDALVMDAPAAKNLVANSLGRLELASVELAAERYALAVSTGAAAGLVTRLNEALRTLAQQGVWSELNERFELQPTSEPSRSASAQN